MITSFTNPPPDTVPTDPNEAANFSLLEAALRSTGAIKSDAPVEISSPYDEYLRMLIDSVPLE